MTKKIAVIGAGPMGLASALELLKMGFTVDIYERDDRLGGMSASFDFDGLQIERYYHFICRPDQPLFELLAELGIYDKLRWRDTKMGFFYDGTLYKWGNPLYLLTFPKLDFLSKLRYALHVFYTKGIDKFDDLDQYNASVWLKKWVGDKAYTLLWSYLFSLKFFEYQHNISAAWIATRIKRVALSRKNLFTEQLGYLEGGSEILLNALEKRILEMGGRIYLKTAVTRVVAPNQQLRGLIVNEAEHHYDGIVSTMPLPYLATIIPDLPPEILNKIKNIINTSIVCVVCKLRFPLTENFWLNTHDAAIEIPGIIEYTNLNPLKDSIVYVPFYMPKTHPKYSQTDEKFVEEVFKYFQRINPAFSQTWVLATQVSRYEFAQPICPPNFFQELPPLQTPIKGLVMADTASYYPEDRSISESVRIGKLLSNLLYNHLNEDN